MPQQRAECIGCIPTKGKSATPPPMIKIITVPVRRCALRPASSPKRLVSLILHVYLKSDLPKTLTPFSRTRAVAPDPSTRPRSHPRPSTTHPISSSHLHPPSPHLISTAPPSARAHLPSSARPGRICTIEDSMRVEHTGILLDLQHTQSFYVPGGIHPPSFPHAPYPHPSSIPRSFHIPSAPPPVDLRVLQSPYPSSPESEFPPPHTMSGGHSLHLTSSSICFGMSSPCVVHRSTRHVERVARLPLSSARPLHNDLPAPPTSSESKRSRCDILYPSSRRITLPSLLRPFKLDKALR
ncbi:hypothetical protein R3P38DRAFT_3240017 [Favolaschia claudopus]|uniref:Uncharacterized protein n=1 Tax=Favolaschia claudopus TaxID=2862362 RepID=A0AAV9Z7Q8_9AGAR